LTWNHGVTCLVLCFAKLYVSLHSWNYVGRHCRWRIKFFLPSRFDYVSLSLTNRRRAIV